MYDNNKNRIVFVLAIVALIIFFEPQGFKATAFPYHTEIDLLYKILKIMVTLFFVVFYLSRKKISRTFKTMALFQTICFASTMINNGSFSRFIGPALTTLSMIIIGEYLTQENLLKKTAKKLIIYFRCLFIINVLMVAMIDTSPGLSGNIAPILGIDNRWIFTYIPWIIFEFINATDKNKKKAVITVLIISELSLIYKWSVAAMLIYPLFLIPILFEKNKFYRKGKTILGFIIAGNYLVVIERIQNTIISTIRSLGKDPTLSGRTYLWDKVLKANTSELLIGRGMQDEATDKLFFGTSYTTSQLKFLYVIHAHNTYMTLLYRFGVISLLLYIYMQLRAFSNLAKASSTYSALLTTALIVCSLLGIFDTIDCAALYLVMGIAESLFLTSNYIKPARRGLREGQIC